MIKPGSCLPLQKEHSLAGPLADTPIRASGQKQGDDSTQSERHTLHNLHVLSTPSRGLKPTRGWAPSIRRST
jgi:hypothetical protein